MRKRCSVWLVAAGLAVGMAGCKPDAAVKKGEVFGAGNNHAPAGEAPADPVASSPAGGGLDPATLGNVTGTVRLNGKAPAPVRIDTSMDPACGAGGGNAFSQQYVVKDGKLANVYLYLKNGPPEAMNAPHDAGASVVMDQKGCVYAPHVIAVMSGGYVEFHNDDSTMHNIHTMPTVVGNDTVDVSQGPHGAPQVKQMQKPENMIPVRCNNHPWMNAFINVSATPFFAVSDGAGHFDLRGLPAGEYTIGALHEKLGEQTMQVTVKPGATIHADFAFAIQ